MPSTHRGRSKSALEETVERIQRFIARRGLKAGDKLPSEVQLIRSFGVSRSVLREAIRRLETLGQVTVQHGSGMFIGSGANVAHFAGMLGSVWNVTPAGLVQFQEFRRLLECFSARRAAERVTPEDIAELYALCDRMDPGEQDFIEIADADGAFHTKIMAVSGNAVIHEVGKSLQAFLRTAIFRIGLKRLEDRRNNALAHRVIADAIASGNPDAAEAAMREHMDLVDHQIQVMDQDAS